MKITVESTDEFIPVDGRYCRVWRGTDSKGQKVALIAVRLEMEPKADQSEMEKDLRNIPMTGFEQTWVCTKEDIGPSRKKKEE
jgi:hypothetical protein